LFNLLIVRDRVIGVDDITAVYYEVSQIAAFHNCSVKNYMEGMEGMAFIVYPPH